MRFTFAVKLALLLTAFPHPHHHHRHRKRVNVPPPPSVEASVYGNGDGQIGNPVACPGYGRYEPGDLGVANKTLACGSRVRLCYFGVRWRCVVARVMDRGPYVVGREFDLMVRTAGAIGFPVGVDCCTGPVRWAVAR